MDEQLIQRVWRRASSCCEYCRLPRAGSPLRFEIDHIISRQHGGAAVAANLALACFFCNKYKGPNIAGFDPESRSITPLFHPRRHNWASHFRWDGPQLVGRTPIGLATVALLRINLPAQLAVRQALIDEGVFPPT